jgi:hypothetical protein
LDSFIKKKDLSLPLADPNIVRHLVTSIVLSKIWILPKGKVLVEKTLGRVFQMNMRVYEPRVCQAIAVAPLLAAKGKGENTCIFSPDSGSCDDFDPDGQVTTTVSSNDDRLKKKAKIRGHLDSLFLSSLEDLISSKANDPPQVPKGKEEKENLPKNGKGPRESKRQRKGKQNQKQDFAQEQAPS